MPREAPQLTRKYLPRPHHRHPPQRHQQGELSGSIMILANFQLLPPVSPSLNLAKPSGGTSWQDISWTGSTWTKINQARPPSFHNKTKKEVEKNDTRLTRTATTFNEDSSKNGGDQKDQCKLGRGQQNKKTQDVQDQYSLNPSSWSVTLPLQSTSVTKLVTWSLQLRQPGDQRLLIGFLIDRPCALLIDQEIRFFVHLPAQIHGGGGKHSSWWRPLLNYLLLNSNTNCHRPMRNYDKDCRLFE